MDTKTEKRKTIESLAKKESKKHGYKNGKA
jgi:hypothetical protein